MTKIQFVALIRGDRYADETAPPLMSFTDKKACGRGVTQGNAKAMDVL